MKIECDNPPRQYSPVKLILETKEEFLNMFALFNHTRFQLNCMPAFDKDTWQKLQEAFDPEDEYQPYHNNIQNFAASDLTSKFNIR